MEMIPADHPRMIATLAASDAALGSGDLYHRYRFDDGLPGESGAFLACSFRVAAMHTLRGDHGGAAALIDLLLARSNDLGLFAEEVDVATGAMIGNYPQGFTHMAVSHEVVRLHEHRSRAEETIAAAANGEGAPVPALGKARLHRVRVNNEARLEIRGCPSKKRYWLKSLGCFTEIIQYRTRLLIPVDRAAAILGLIDAAG